MVSGALALVDEIMREEDQAFRAGDAGSPVNVAMLIAIFNLGMQSAWRTAVLVCVGLTLVTSLRAAVEVGLSVPTWP